MRSGRIGRRCRSGHVLLPMFGFMYFLPWFLFLAAVVSHCANLHGSMPASNGHLLGAVFMSCCVGVPLYVLLLMATIFFAITTEELEAWAQRVGLGANQYWSGANTREKLAREATRIAHFALALLLGYLTASWAFPRSLDLTLLGAAAFAHGYYILLFVGVIARVRHHWPRALAFNGDPSARYHHVF